MRCSFSRQGIAQRVTRDHLSHHLPAMQLTCGNIDSTGWRVRIPVSRRRFISTLVWYAIYPSRSITVRIFIYAYLARIQAPGPNMAPPMATRIALFEVSADEMLAMHSSKLPVKSPLPTIVKQRSLGGTTDMSECGCCSRAASPGPRICGSGSNQAAIVVCALMLRIHQKVSGLCAQTLESFYGVIKLHPDRGPAEKGGAQARGCIQSSV